jgi:hypothetical protein
MIMNKKKQFGILLILVGLCIPLSILPFLSGYARDKGVIDNLYQVGIELRKADHSAAERQLSGAAKERTTTRSPNFSALMPKRIPYRLFLAVALVFLYIGIVNIMSSSNPDADETKEQE